MPTDMNKMKYGEYDAYVPDNRAPRFVPQSRILTDRDISLKNLNPDQINTYLDDGGIIKLHRSLRDEIPIILLLIISVVGIIFLTLSDQYNFPGSFPAQIFVPLVIIALIFHRRLNATYYVDKDGISFVKGILTLYLSRVPIEYSKLRLVEVGKNIIQRMLKVGDLRISTQLIDPPEVSIWGIANPYFYAAIIRDRIRKAEEDGNRKLDDANKEKSKALND